MQIFFFLDVSTQEGGERFELVTSDLLGVVPADWTIYWERSMQNVNIEQMFNLALCRATNKVDLVDSFN